MHSIRPQTPPSAFQQEALSGFQISRANIEIQGANEFLKSIYNIVQTQDS